MEDMFNAATPVMPPEPVKRGWKTSEFWVTILSSNLILFNEQLGLHLPVDAIVSISGMVIAYVFGRSITKK